MNPVDKKYLIGIDAGTTSIKGVILSEDGKQITSAGIEYSLETDNENICEVDPEIYWNLSCAVIREMIEKALLNKDQIAGIAFSSQGETLIVTDKNGKPLRKAIVWLDNRSVKEAEIISTTLGEYKIAEITGQPEVVATWPATRILWLKENEPEIFSNAFKYLLVADYLIFRLTGKYCTEHSLVSSTLYFDIHRKVWWDEMLTLTGISSLQLPELLPSGTFVGNITESAAEACGLSTSVKVVTGAYDHPAAAIGSGNVEPGMVSLSLGASMAMCITLDKPFTGKDLKIPCQCHALQDLYYIFPYTQTAGMVLKWFRNEFFSEGLSNKSFQLMDLLAAEVKPGSDGLIMIPHLMGSGSPDFNPNARAAFYGLSLNTTKGHFIRAILEAVAYTIEHNLSTMRKKGIEVHQIQLLGGGSQSPLWCQIIADVTGIPIITLKNSENAAIGASLLAGFGSGIFKDLKQTAGNFLEIRDKYTAIPINHKIYSSLFLKYLELSAILT